MPDLDFAIHGVESAAHGLTPLLEFKLQVANRVIGEWVPAVILHAQIQIQPGQRAYTAVEKERLIELFGTPDRWGQTLRNRLWTHVHTTIPAFSGRTEARLAVTCTYDLNVAATKYFYALEAGGVPLLFLFSGTVFYAADEGRWQIEQIPWSRECFYTMPSEVWRQMMDRHYPNSAWLSLQRDVFDRLYAYKRREGIATWEQVVERLLPEMEVAPA